MLARLIREPLVHFLGLSFAIFAAFGYLGSAGITPSGEVVVTAARVEQLAVQFANAWRRPPSQRELQGLIEELIKEEIYAREAVTLGLDRDDPVIRRRLRQKMEAMNQAEAAGLTPTDAELAAYIRENPGPFLVEPQIAFRHVYLNPARRGLGIERDAAATLERLRDANPDDTAALGDATLLPPRLDLTPAGSIDRVFGPAFAEALAEVEVGRWFGPVASAYGLHLLRIDERKPGRLPELAEVRTLAMREWTEARRVVIEAERFAAVRSRYRVRIDAPARGPEL